jgi:glutathione S-transferase
VAKYLGKKYGYSPDAGEAAGAHVVEKLGALAARLKAQRAAGSGYVVGNSLTAADIYSAAFVAMFRPLPDTQCAMEPSTRAAFESCDAATLAALDPVLLEHREKVYRDHLELPLAL